MASYTFMRQRRGQKHLTHREAEQARLQAEQDRIQAEQARLQAEERASRETALTPGRRSACTALEAQLRAFQARRSPEDP